MQAAHHAALMSAVPTQDLLLMVIVFMLAALVLLAISIEAGNYPQLTAAMRKIAHAVRGRMHRHWSDDGYRAGRQAIRH